MAAKNYLAAALWVTAGAVTAGAVTACAVTAGTVTQDPPGSAVQGSATDTTTEFERKTSAPGDPASFTGGTRPGPESDSDKPKRGNTPPGLDRAGNPPSAGAIVDPAGVTKGPVPR